MKDLIAIDNLRCSIFVPKVAYNGDNITKMMTAFPGYLPSSIPLGQVPFQLMGLPILPPDINNQPWQLTSSNNKEVITFYDDKIDIIINLSNIKYSVELLKETSKHCCEMFERIMNTFKFTSIRLAIAPTLRVPFGEKEHVTKSGFLSRVFLLNEFEGTHTDNCDFSQVFRINRQLHDKTYLVNHLIKFSTEQINKIENNTLHVNEVLVSSLDINTFVNPTYNMGISELNEFYQKSPNWCENLINYYFFV